MKVPRSVSLSFSVVIALVLAWRPAAAQRPLGTDVSYLQGTNINWAAVKSSGLVYAWAEATESTTFIDPAFAQNATNARAAGILFGAYHYARYDVNLGPAGADLEANYFWQNASNVMVKDGKSLQPILVVEQGPGTNNTRATVAAWVNEWCNHLVALGASNGVVLQPLIQTTVSVATNYLDVTVTQWPLSMIYFKSGKPQSTAPPPAPWPSWLNYVYGNTNTISGITGVADADVFNGTTDTLQTLLVIGNFGPTNTLLPVGATNTFSVTAAGAGPFTYQWFSNSVTIPNATNSTFSLSNLQPAYAGPYSVSVSTTNGTLFTANATLSILSTVTNGFGSLIVPTNLITWWPGENNPNDLVGTNNLVPFNGVSYGPGEVGNAFVFNGLNTFLSNNLASLTPPWTFAVWVNRQDAPTGGAAITGDGDGELKLEQWNGTRHVGVTEFTYYDALFSPVYTVPTNVWTHLTFVGTGTNTLLYVNGLINGSMTNVFALPRRYIGMGYADTSGLFVDFMLGSLDEIMIFNRVLTATEILDIYGTGHSGLVRSPQFSSIAGAGKNQVRLNFAGLPGKNLTVYSSTNLTTWTAIGTATNLSGIGSFTDSSATNTRKFYRLSQP